MNRHPFCEQVVPRIEELVRKASRLAGQTPGLLVALSGGPDSVALLLAARDWARRQAAVLEAGHLNHQLRGRDSLADEDFCRALCADLGIALHVRRIDPRPEARRRQRGLEEAARSLRRRFLEELLDSHDHLHCAATGHHRDDQAETIVMRLFRGTGLDGLCGIPPVSGRIIHPLLGVTRRDILGFLQDRQQPWRLDATNDTGENTRSRVRRELLPLVRDIFGGGADKAPARLAELVTDDLASLDALAQKALDQVVAADRLVADRGALLALDVALARRVVRLLVSNLTGQALDVSRTHVDDLLRWAGQGRSGSSLSWYGGWTVVREFDQLRFVPPGGAAQPLAADGPYRLRLIGSPQPIAAAPVVDDSTWRLDCPVNAVRGRLRLRPWRAGDRIQQLGLRGHRKISDLLAQKRVGVTQRPGVLVVEDDAGILWVVGWAQAERTRILPSTQQIVTIAIARAVPEGGQSSQP